MGFRDCAGQGMRPAFADRSYPATAAGPAPSCVTARPDDMGGSLAPGRDAIADHRPALVLADGGGHLDEHNPLDAGHPGRARPGLPAVHASTADKSCLRRRALDRPAEPWSWSGRARFPRPGCPELDHQERRKSMSRDSLASTASAWSAHLLLLIHKSATGEDRGFTNMSN